jgi:hypothetical protein
MLGLELPGFIFCVVQLLDWGLKMCMSDGLDLSALMTLHNMLVSKRRKAMQDASHVDGIEVL